MWFVPRRGPAGVPLPSGSDIVAGGEPFPPTGVGVFEQLRRIFVPAGSRADPSDPRLQAAIEQVVEGTDPRFRLVRGYRKRLADPVAAALAHIDGLGAALPGPHPVEPARYGADPALRALLGSPERLRAVFAGSRPLRDFLRHPHNTSVRAAMALLVARRRVRTIFCHDLEGETLQRDVLQEVVEFEEPQAVVPAADEAGLRQRFRERLFNDLVEHALEAVVTLRGRGERLKERRRLLAAKLRALDGSERFGLQGELAGRGNLRPDLEALDEELAALQGDPMDLAEFLDVVRGVLEGCPDYLHMEPVALGCNGVHIVPGEGGTGGTERFTLSEVRYGKGRRLVVLPVRLGPALIDAVRHGSG